MPLYAIPGQDPLEVRHLVLDYNGTLATDGTLVPGVAERLRELALPPHSLTIHVVTADTMGTVERQLHGLPCELSILGPDRCAIRSKSAGQFGRSRPPNSVETGRAIRLKSATFSGIPD